MIRKIKEWWRGKYQEPTAEQLYDQQSESYEEFQRPWLARTVTVFARFWLRNWKWLMTFILGFLILAVTAYDKFLKT